MAAAKTPQELAFDRRLERPAEALAGHQAQLVGNMLALDHKLYVPGDNSAVRDGGNFGATTPLKNIENPDDAVMLKRAKQPSPAESDKLAKEAAISALADRAAPPGQSRVVGARAVVTDNDGNVAVVSDLMKNGDTQAMFDQLNAAFTARSITPAEYADAINYLCYETTKGVQQIGSAGVVHRDIKPDNVFLDDHMGVKIGDFGLATYIGDKGGAGALPFTSPEQVAQTAKVVKDDHTAVAMQMRKRDTDQGVDVHCLGRTFLVFARGALRLRELETLGEAMTVAELAKRPSIEDVLKRLQAKDLQYTDKARAILEKVKSGAPKAKPDSAFPDPDQIHGVTKVPLTRPQQRYQREHPAAVPPPGWMPAPMPVEDEPSDYQQAPFDEAVAAAALAASASAAPAALSAPSSSSSLSTPALSPSSLSTPASSSSSSSSSSALSPATPASSSASSSSSASASAAPESARYVQYATVVPLPAAAPAPAAWNLPPT